MSLKYIDELDDAQNHISDGDAEIKREIPYQVTGDRVTGDRLFVTGGGQRVTDVKRRDRLKGT